MTLEHKARTLEVLKERFSSESVVQLVEGAQLICGPEERFQVAVARVGDTLLIFVRDRTTGDRYGLGDIDGEAAALTDRDGTTLILRRSSGRRIRWQTFDLVRQRCLQAWSETEER